MKDFGELIKKLHKKLTGEERSFRPSVLFSLQGNIVSSLIARAPLLLKPTRHFVCRCRGRFAHR